MLSAKTGTASKYLSRALLLVIAFWTHSAWAQAAYQEAPALAERVAAGELPPVAERLPESPPVLEPVEQVGTYGGEWRTSLVDSSPNYRTMGNETLMRWQLDGTEISPNVAESVTPNEAGTVFTVKLREGMRWSDGEPFTADDIMFWYEDVFSNSELTDAPTSWLTTSGEPVVVEKVDDTTLTFSFAEPNGMFLTFLAIPDSLDITSHPRHYMAQFHADYNENVQQLVEAGGYQNWTDLYGSRNAWEDNADKPVLFAWQLTTAMGDTTTRAVAERNPYYWKVDPEGNQLPYIDRIVYEIITDEQVAVLKTINGEFSLPYGVSNPENKAVFFDNAETGDYHFIAQTPSNMNVAILSFNLTHQNPVKRQVFNNKDFRIGVSHAINRQEIIDLVLFGQSEAWQAAPLSESPLYDEELAKQYTEFDPDLANEHLDRVLPERDAEGFRIGPDGKRFTVVLEVSTHNQTRLDITQLLEPQLRAVGLDFRVRPLERDLFYERKGNNLPDATIWSGPGGLIDAMISPRYYFPFDTESNFAVPWAAWFQGDTASAQEPPEAAKRQMELYEQLRTRVEPDERVALMKEILAIAKEEFYVIGVAQEVEAYSIVKNNFHNVPAVMPDSYLFSTPALARPEQFFISDALSSAPTP